MKQTATSIVERTIHNNLKPQEFEGERVMTIQGDLVVMGTESMFNVKLEFHIPERIAFKDMEVVPVMCWALDTGQKDDELIAFMNHASPDGWDQNCMVTVLLEEQDLEPGQGFDSELKEFE